MKQKFLICLTITVLLVMLLTGCADAKSPQKENSGNETTLRETEQTTTVATTAIQNELLSEQEYEVVVCNAYSLSSKIFEQALNADRLDDESFKSIPVYKFDTTEDLRQFQGMFYREFSWGREQNELPTFGEVSKTFDDAFFEKNTLLLAYVKSPSETYRYDVRRVYCDGESLRITLYQVLENLAVENALVTGWFVTVAVPDSLVSDVTVFDAELEGAENIESAMSHLLLPTRDYEVEICYSNHCSNMKIYELALNAERLKNGNSWSGIPVYKFDTAEDLVQFEQEFGDEFTLTQRHDEMPSFREVSPAFDEVFFEDKTLLLAYVPSGSGTCRYDVRGVSVDGSSLVIDIVQTRPYVTEDMAGWFLMVAISDELASEITSFDTGFTSFVD